MYVQFISITPPGEDRIYVRLMMGVDKFHAREVGSLLVTVDEFDALHEALMHHEHEGEPVQVEDEVRFR